MKMQIESTETLTELDGVTVRVWHGKTQDGVGCLVFVHRIAVDPALAARFGAELVETKAPREAMPS